MSQIKTCYTTEKLESSIINTIQSIVNATGNSNVINVGLSGASLIKTLASILPKTNIDLSKLRFYFCDERYVNVDDPDSTYGTYIKLFNENQVNVDLNKQFYKINENLDIQECADNYSKIIEENVPKNENGIPSFDVLFLGIGPDGHTCSLFPNHLALSETEKLIVHVEDSPKPPPKRVTFTYKLINAAKNILFVATGKSKQNIIKEIFIEGKDYPASRVKGKNVIWFLDQESSSLLPSQFTT